MRRRVINVNKPVVSRHYEKTEAGGLTTCLQESYIYCILNGISHSYQLDKSISDKRVVG